MFDLLFATTTPLRGADMSPIRISRAAACVLALSLAATNAAAHERVAPIADVQQEAEPAFDKTWALGAYLNTWRAGDYDAFGVGGKLRFEPLSWLGVEVFAEIYDVDWPTASRQDVPIGFSLYIPIALTDWLRVRPMLGACSTFSFIESKREGAPGADDVLFGVHGGAGVELAVAQEWSIFLDAQGVVWTGHDRTVEGWTGAVGEELSTTSNLQLSFGLQMHL